MRRRLFGILLSLALVLGMMPVMSVKVLAAEGNSDFNKVFKNDTKSYTNNCIKLQCTLISAPDVCISKDNNVTISSLHGEKINKVEIYNSYPSGYDIQNANITGATKNVTGNSSATFTINNKTSVVLNATATVWINRIKVYYTYEPVSEVSLNVNTAKLDAGKTMTLTATVKPTNATDKTVKWSVGGTDAGAVKLYSNEACTTEVSKDATNTLTVYAKGISEGTATVTCTSNSDSTKSASCVVTVSEVTYGLWVGGVKVTNTNADNIDGNGKASYNPEIGTLTLNGYSYNGDGYVTNNNNGAIYFTGDNLTISIEGDNTVTSTNSKGAGIYIIGNCMINGSGSLTMSGPTYGIRTGGTLTIGGGTVTANADKQAIRGNKGVNISGGKVEANALANDGYGITGDENQYKLTIEDKVDSVLITAGECATDFPTINAIAGTGWTDTAGTTVPDSIAVSSTGEVLKSYRKIHFPVYVPANGVTLDKTSAQTINVDGKVSFTATIEPEDATDKKVKWSVSGTDANSVKLYSDEACTTEVGTDATEILTVYAKGISLGSSTITVTCNADSSKSANCAVTVAHTHTIGEGESAQTIVFTAWDKYDSLPDKAGNYYLTTNVYLNSTWEVPEGTTNLCLNGNEINVYDKDQAILVDNGRTLNLFGDDDKENFKYGNIHNNWELPENGVIYVKGKSMLGMYDESQFGGNKAKNCIVRIENSTFNMYGGSIMMNETENYGAVFLDENSTFNMYGGSIVSNSSSENGHGGVYVSGSAKLNLSGNPRIESNTAGNGIDASRSNVYLEKFTTPTVRVIGKLKNDDDQGSGWNNATIGITMEKPGVFTTGSTDELKASTYWACFNSDDQTCQVITDGNELKIKSPHTHDFAYSASGATITATCKNQGCTLKDSKVVLTLVKPTRTTYDGTGSEKASLNGLNDFNNATEKSIEDTDIKYYKAEKSGDTYKKYGDALSSAPTNVGDYLAEISVAFSKGGVGTIYIASVGYSIAPAVIDSVEVTGIDAPTANMALDTTAIPSTANVTLGKVTWAPATSPAAYATKYKATVLATADANYIFADALTAKVNGNEATVTKNQDGSLSISYEFAKTALNPVTITATDKEVNYSTDGISIPVEGMFTITPGAGKAMYIVTKGTGEGTFDVETGKLTVTKCGTFNISVSTAETDTYAAGAAKTATLTVNKIAPAVTAPIGKNLTYNGQQQELVTAGGSDDGEMQYALGTNAKTAPLEGWDTSVPKKTESAT